MPDVLIDICDGDLSALAGSGQNEFDVADDAAGFRYPSACLSHLLSQHLLSLCVIGDRDLTLHRADNGTLVVRELHQFMMMVMMLMIMMVLAVMASAFAVVIMVMVVLMMLAIVTAALAVLIMVVMVVMLVVLAVMASAFAVFIMVVMMLVLMMLVVVAAAFAVVIMVMMVFMLVVMVMIMMVLVAMVMAVLVVMAVVVMLALASRLLCGYGFFFGYVLFVFFHRSKPPFADITPSGSDPAGLSGSLHWRRSE